MPPRIPIRSFQGLGRNFTSPNSRNVSILEELRPLLRLQTSYQPTPHHRTLSSSSPLSFRITPTLLKKKEKNKPSSSSSSNASEESSSATEENDPFDFSSLQAGIDKSLEKLKNDLGKLRTGGRFNPEVLEGLRVKLEKDAKESFRLGDLAQVLPKGGRSIVLMVGDKDHIKPITSTIQSAPNLQLQPQPDSHNPLALNIPIPPPTKESRDLALQAASKAGEQATMGVRNARGAMQKKLRAMEIKKAVRPDDSKKAHKEMEKVVEKGNGEVKKLVEAARKGMEQN